MTLAIEPMINMGTEKTRILADKWTVITRTASRPPTYEHVVLITKTSRRSSPPEAACSRKAPPTSRRAR
jgi:methionine aminopeptidase